MKRLLKLTPVVFALAFAAACGGDDDDDGDDNNGGRSGSAGASGSSGSSGTAGTSGDSGTGGGGTDPACKGTYTGWTESQVTEKASAGACEDDIPAVCANDVNTAAGACGQMCVLQFPDDQAAQAMCALECVQEELDPDPSNGCLACYIASVSCAAQFCLSECLDDPNADECLQCRVENDCTPGFFRCSGLPVPDGSGAGGAGGSGGSP